ncbi:hypothetical protein Avbf_06024 [Armadillidium vulgare]|nr:hypothetical protein Avbf_06024 [Armadillidium vulgare]
METDISQICYKPENLPTIYTRPLEWIKIFETFLRRRLFNYLDYSHGNDEEENLRLFYNRVTNGVAKSKIKISGEANVKNGSDILVTRNSTENQVREKDKYFKRNSLSNLIPKGASSVAEGASANDNHLIVIDKNKFKLNRERFTFSNASKLKENPNKNDNKRYKNNDNNNYISKDIYKARAHRTTDTKSG